MISLTGIPNALRVTPGNQGDRKGEAQRSSCSSLRSRTKAWTRPALVSVGVLAR
ncbi:MAG TPA: hypothetical protein VFD49_23325 [Candidatus Dormibacteraeota bacterium]|nr:hypothetical protein [Candidatus Dormibacteraeota bacterium]